MQAGAETPSAGPGHTGHQQPMTPEKPVFSRQATHEELGRLETARASLRRSAWWVAAVALVLPAALAVVITVSMLVTFPGSRSEMLFGLLLGYAALFSVFTGSMLLHETGHALASWRRLTKDAAGGFRIVREHGEVKWGKHSYVAVVGGRRLFSPYFTDLASVPGFWRHFDRLTPGPYVFELLAESGLVLSAEPDQHDVRVAPQRAPSTWRCWPRFATGRRTARSIGVGWRAERSVGDSSSRTRGS
jgi:hypothetical protein